MDKEYLSFINNKGIYLEEKLGVKEWALKAEDALLAIELLKDKIIIVGGDVLTRDNSDEIKYAIHVWGDKYCYLDWSITEKTEGENMTNRIIESHNLAKNKIIEAIEVAKKLGKDCYIVLVI